MVAGFDRGEGKFGKERLYREGNSLTKKETSRVKENLILVNSLKRRCFRLVGDPRRRRAMTTLGAGSSKLEEAPPSRSTVGQAWR